MNRRILDNDVQIFIQEHCDDDPITIALKKPLFEGVSQQELAAQLECRKKSMHKLPTWFTTPAIYYPKKVNLEQTSSETTAKYKATWVNGSSLLDGTGGFGVDSLYFAKNMQSVIHCELDESLSKIAQYNFGVLGISNISFHIGDGLGYLRDTTQHFDWVYLDPSRRDKSKGKVFQLQEYHPNVPKNLDLIFQKTDNILLKTAPLLDISKGIGELQYVKEIHVVAVNNEVKELLWILKKGFSEEILIRTVNLKKGVPEIFDFHLSDEKETSITYSAPKTYLYEPNAAILKSGGFKSIGKRFQLKKLAVHSHLYTHEDLVNFPGRRFEILKKVPYNKKAIMALGIKKANITTRNFPLTVAEIRKRFAIKDGGNDYLFFTSLENTHTVLWCKRV